MKKKILLCLSLLGASFSLLFAQKEGSMPQQGTYPALTEKSSTAPKDPDLNFVWDDGSSAKKGVLFFGTTLKDGVAYPSVVRFYSTKTLDIERLGPIAEKNEFKIKVLHGGTYTGDKYIGYIVTLYTHQVLPHAFVEIDTNTGEIKTIRQYVYESPESQNWPTIYELAYDHKNKQCWGLGRSKRTDKAVSAVYKINTNTGEFTFVKDLDVYVFGAAYDYDGNLYGIIGKPNAEGNYVGSQIVQFDTTNFQEIESTKKEIKRDNSAIIPNYTHTVDFDHTTGDLYWLASDNSGIQYAVKVDPKSGESLFLGSIGFGDIVTGLYIPYEIASERKAPARVEDLSATFDSKNKNNAKITWKNPSKTWDKTELPSIQKVYIARDKRSNIVSSIAGGHPGATMQWIDTNVPQGIHTYYVKVENSAGMGVLDSIRCYVGEDIPGKVENLKREKKGSDIEITWSAPTKGGHEGWIDPSKISYSVIRMPDQKVVVENTKETTFLDNTLGVIQAYSYIIVPKNDVGKGVPTESEKIKAGQAYSTPYHTSFKTQDDADSWTVLDANKDGKTFEYLGGSFDNFQRMALDPAPYEQAADDWLFSPAITLKAGKRYEIIIQTQLDIAYSVHNFSVNIGKGASVAAQKEIQKFEDYTSSKPNQIQTEVMTVDISEDGNYNLGIHCTSVGTMEVRNKFSIQDVMVKELYKKDLSVEEFEISELIKDLENKVAVKIYNEGSEAQSSYKVRLLEVKGDNATILAETSDVPIIESKKGAVCFINYNPQVEGMIKLAAEVVLEGDGEKNNNRSQTFDVKILPAGTAPWSHLITRNSITHETTLPMSFSRQYSVGQTIYHAEELALVKDALISRMAYDYINGVASVEDVDVKIYMANVDIKDYKDLTPVAACMNPKDMTLVYEGQLSIKDGVNRMEFNFSKDFEYQKDKHLCIQVWKEGTTGNSYPAQFVTFGKGSGELRSMRYMARNELNPSNPNAQAMLLLDWVPQLRLAIKGGTGVQEVVVGAAISYNSMTKKLQLGNFNASMVRVYDLTGRLIEKKHVVEGNYEVDLDLTPGVYVVTAQGVDGSTASIKVSVNQ